MHDNWFLFQMFCPTEIQFRDSFDTEKQKKMTQEYLEIRGLNTKSFSIDVVLGVAVLAS